MFNMDVHLITCFTQVESNIIYGAAGETAAEAARRKAQRKLSLRHSGVHTRGSSDSKDDFEPDEPTVTAHALTIDHTCENPDEVERVEAAGGFVEPPPGCARARRTTRLPFDPRRVVSQIHAPARVVGLGGTRALPRKSPAAF